MGVFVLTVTVDEDETDIVLAADELEAAAREMDGVTEVGIRITDEEGESDA